MPDKLILLLPPKKPPFIGILMSRADAETLNNDLILQHKKRKYEIVLEAYKSILNVRLICREIVIVRFYNHVNYDFNELKSWLYILDLDKCGVVNFSQLLPNNGKFEVARTAQLSKPFVLKVSKVEIIYSKD